MVESVGKKLSMARQKRALTLEEVAHVTKLRPDKIVALETDDYSSFPSTAYAKGFLQIYARYLRVDVSEFLSSLDSSNSISVADYQYLSNAPTPKPVETERRRDERHPPSIAPLIAFVLLVVIVLGSMYIYTNYKRTLPSHASDTEESSGGSQSATPAPSHAETSPAKPEKLDKPTKPPVAAAPRAVATPAASSLPTSTPAIAPAPAFTPATKPLASMLPTPAPAFVTGGDVSENPGGTALMPVPTPRTGSSAMSDRDFITPTAVTTPDPAAATSPPSGLNEVLVASIKKTWVTIRRDDPKAPPIFEDYIYPNTNPLKLKGARFFIDARDPGSVQITKNGLPLSSPDANTPVQ